MGEVFESEIRIYLGEVCGSSVSIVGKAFSVGSIAVFYSYGVYLNTE
jgi:hypothetical protein